MGSVATIRSRAARPRGVETREPTFSTARGLSSWPWAAGGESSQSTSTATTHGAVYACVSKIVGLFTAMDVTTWTTSNGVKRQVTDPPIVTNPSPDPSLDQPHWLAQVMCSWLFRGDVFGTVVQESTSGWPTKIDVIHPDKVRSRTADGHTQWLVNGKAEPLWTEGGQLWHVPSWMIGPGTNEGVDPISKAAADVGLGLAARQYGAEWFRAGGHPTAVISSPSALTEDQTETIQGRWVSGIESGGRTPRVLGADLKYQALQITPDQSQMLEMLQANISDVCRFFGVPPEEIGSSSGDTNTYANVEGRAVQMLRNMAPWLALVQRMWSALLPRPQQVRLDPSIILRMTPKIDAEVWTERIRGSQQTPNEARVSTGLAPMPGGDSLLWPPYMVTPAKAPPTEIQGEGP